MVEQPSCVRQKAWKSGVFVKICDLGNGVDITAGIDYHATHDVLRPPKLTTRMELEVELQHRLCFALQNTKARNTTEIISVKDVDKADITWKGIGQSMREASEWLRDVTPFVITLHELSGKISDLRSCRIETQEDWLYGNDDIRTVEISPYVCDLGDFFALRLSIWYR
jgi:hypothetical protein